MKQIGVVLTIVLLLVCCSPVMAYIANSSSIVTSYTDTQHSGATYLPYQYEFIFIGLAIICWGLMKYNSELEVLYSILAMILFGITAYFAPYITINDAVAVVDVTNGETTILYTQLVTPQPILQIFLVVCFLFSLIITLYFIFLRSADTSIESTGLGYKENDE